jgi:hypothetical protein
MLGRIKYILLIAILMNNSFTSCSSKDVIIFYATGLCVWWGIAYCGTINTSKQSVTDNDILYCLTAPLGAAAVYGYRHTIKKLLEKKISNLYSGKALTAISIVATLLSPVLAKKLFVITQQPTTPPLPDQPYKPQGDYYTQRALTGLTISALSLGAVHLAHHYFPQYMKS